MTNTLQHPAASIDANEPTPFELRLADHHEAMARFLRTPDAPTSNRQAHDRKEEAHAELFEARRAVYREPAYSAWDLSQKITLFVELEDEHLEDYQIAFLRGLREDVLRVAEHHAGQAKSS